MSVNFATRFRPQAQWLEDRTAPAHFTWTGNVSEDWADAKNWRYRDGGQLIEYPPNIPPRIPGAGDDVFIHGGNIRLPDGAAAEILYVTKPTTFDGGSLFVSRHLFLTPNPDAGTLGQVVFRSTSVTVNRLLSLDSGVLTIESSAKVRAHEVTAVAAGQERTAEGVAINVGGVLSADILGIYGENAPNLGGPTRLNVSGGLVEVGDETGDPRRGYVVIRPSGFLYMSPGSRVEAPFVLVTADAGEAGLLSGAGVVDADVVNDGIVRVKLLDEGRGGTRSIDENQFGLVGSSYLAIDGSYVQSADGELGIDVAPIKTVTSSFSITGTARLAGELSLNFKAGLNFNTAGELVKDGVSTFTDTLLTAGNRTRLIALTNTAVPPIELLAGRFTRVTGTVPRDPRVLTPDGLGEPRDDIFYAVHFDANSQSIQLFTTETPSVYRASGAIDALTVGGKPATTNTKLSLVVPGSAATASQMPAPGFLPWVNDLATYIRRAAVPDWDVATLNWEWFSTGYPTDAEDPRPADWRPWKAARQGMDIGEGFFQWLRETGLLDTYHDYHLYSHSAGNWLINGVAQGLKETNYLPSTPGVPSIPIGGPFVQMTMFDAFAPHDGRFQSFAELWSADTDIIRWGTPLPLLGQFADYAEQILDRRQLLGGPAVPFTDTLLPTAFNIDVTRLDPIQPDSRIVSKLDALLHLIEGDTDYPPRLRSHAWPHIVYRTGVVAAKNVQDGATDEPTDPLYLVARSPEFTGQRPMYEGVRQRDGFLSLPRLAAASLAREYTAGTGAGGSPIVRSYNPDGALRYQVAAFEDSFTGGVRTAAADFNADGIADVVVGTGPGRATRVRILDGNDQHELFTFDPFEATFTGGVYVTAGDLTGDGVPDLVITPDEGGGPRVRVLDGNGFGVVADFFGIDDPDFRGGARAAVGDVDGDGVGDLVVAAGFGGGPRVAGFSGPSLATATPARVFPDFLAFEPTLRNGVFVTAGDIDGDGKGEVIAGGGPGGGPRVTAFSGSSLLGGAFDPIANFFGGDPENRGGIRVAVKDLDGDTRADLVVGAGAGAGSRVTSYLGKDVSQSGTPMSAFDFDAFPEFSGGVFIG